MTHKGAEGGDDSQMLPFGLRLPYGSLHLAIISVGVRRTLSRKIALRAIFSSFANATGQQVAVLLLHAVEGMFFLAADEYILYTSGAHVAHS